MRVAASAALLFCATAWALVPRTAAAGEAVIFTVLDAVRPDHLGAYGYRRPTSPALDASAAAGTRFTQAFTNAPWTRPAAATLLTGLPPARHRTETDRARLPPGIVTLAARLRAAGWHTAGFVANGHAGSLAALERGFDHFEDPSRSYPRGARGPTLLNGLPRADFIVARALAHARQCRAEKLFLFVFLVDAHDPYQADAATEARFVPTDARPLRRTASWEVDNDYPPAERAGMIGAYDAAIAGLDAAFARLLAGMAAAGYPQPSLLVTADHGEAFGEHGFYLHAHHFWDEVIRVPLWASGPRWEALGGRRGATDARLAQGLDVAPTLLAMCGAPPAPLPGRSLAAPPRRHTRIVASYNEHGIHRAALLDAHHKVVLQRPASRGWFMRAIGDPARFPSVRFDREVVQAFDRARDPAEQHDLAAALPRPVRRHVRTLRRVLRRAGGS